MAISDFSPDLFFSIDKSKIIITMDDLKYIPQLSEYIPLQKIIKENEIYLDNLDFNIQNKIILLFLENYHFIQFFGSKKYFNYTKLEYYWPNNTYYHQIFDNLRVSKEIDIEGVKYKYYLLDDINDYYLNYIGVLFFSAYSKIKDEKEFVEKEYDFFTDSYFENSKNGIIEDLKEFFIKQLSVFIDTLHGNIYGSNDFGSNIKTYIQNKSSNIILEKIYADFDGFINDISYLYGQFIELRDLEINQVDEYSIEIIIVIHFNNELLRFTITKTI